MKKQITDALLNIHKSAEWGPKLREWNIQEFASVDDSLYNLETEIMDLVKGLSLSNAYY
jgi:hypothetical protein